ncbi:MAG TPA: response regulator [Candidatus Acidoferrales bacterium]|nr:response regulator [Candidatus Acidoferrales bacterium]
MSSPAQPPRKAGRESSPVLVIEDEPGVVALVRAALERRGYRVVEAASGAEGLRMLESEIFAGVISDVRTPGGVSGADVQAWIRCHRPALAPRLVFITGDVANTETLALLRRTGAPCLEKPFRVGQLLSIVEQTIGAP